MTAIPKGHVLSLISEYRNGNINGITNPKDEDASKTAFSELKEIYDSQYEPMHERIDNMGDPKTVTISDKNSEPQLAKEITAEQYRSIIPTFEKWIAMQETFQDIKFQTLGNQLQAESLSDNQPAQVTESDNIDVATKEQTSSSIEAFAEFMEKTPEEILFEAFLKRHDMTVEDFEKLTAEEKQAYMKEFEEELKARARRA